MVVTLSALISQLTHPRFELSKVKRPCQLPAASQPYLTVANTWKGYSFLSVNMREIYSRLLKLRERQRTKIVVPFS